MTKQGNETGYDLEQDPEQTYNPGFADSGRASERDGNVLPGRNLDISQPAKVTLGNYLSAASKGQVTNVRPSSFGIPGGSSDTQGTGQSVSANASTRLPGQVTRGEMESAGSTLGSFLDLTRGYGSTAGDKFNDLKNSEYARGQNPFMGTDIKRVGSDERRKGLDGHSLLSRVQGTDPSTAVDLGAPNIAPPPDTVPLVQRKISEVLRQNRFNPITRAFVENHKRTTPGGYTVQRKMGAYTLGDEAPEVSEEKLKEVGLQLIVRATGHGVPGADLLDPKNSLQEFSNLAPLIPSITQFTGLPLIDTENLKAGNVPITDSDASSNPGRTEYINQENPEFSTFSGKSYGVLNSHFEPFGGPLPVGTLTTTVAGILAIVGFSAAIAAVPMLVGGGNIIRNDRPHPSTLRMGRRGLLTDSTSSDILELFGIPKTDHNWGHCLLVGLRSFLGFGNRINSELSLSSPGSILTPESVLAGAFNIATAPGYYAVVIRNAIRDTEQVVRATEEFASNSSNGSAILAASSFFKIVESITTSSTYRFMITMVGIGNQALNDANPTSVNVDDLRYCPETRQSKSRVTISSGDIPDIGSRDRSALVWKHSSAGSRYLLPHSFHLANARMNGTDGKLSSAALVRFGSVSGTPGRALPKLPDGSDSSVGEMGPENRLPNAYVREVEDKLESEYMPFYFHDLRTNEIISFHAFLSDLSDGFTANYTSTSGYGRIEDVMVYNNTKRSIALTFFVAATSESDLSVMYWNINKLVSMLYPQFSRGRSMQFEDKKFIQPFSQIPTASPMIRLRVGDIVKGNYSKFGIARLFGLGQSVRVFNGDRDAPPATVSPAGEPSAEKIQAATLAVNDRIRTSADVGYNVEDRVLLNPGTHQFMTVARTPAQSNPTRGIYVTSPAVEIVNIFLESSFIPTSTGPSNSRSRERTPTSETANIIYIVRVSEADAPNTPPESRYHEVRHTDIVGFSQDYIDSLIEDELRNKDEGESIPIPEEIPYNAVNLTNFLNAEQNPLIRSFETTQGRGLAGFITDLKLDWADAPWEINPGNRAPIFMKLSISFAPIHDIPMGLDSDGMMRSVAYNVGDISNIVGSDPYESYDRLLSELRGKMNAAGSAVADSASTSAPSPPVG